MYVIWISAALLVLFAADHRERRDVAGVAKTIASLGFLAAGLHAGLWSAGGPGRAVFIGLCLGALGDVLLISRSKKPFLAGILAFLANHVAYGLAFVLLGISPLLVGLALLPLSGIAWLVWRTVGSRAGSLAPAVAAYVVVITAMVALAAGAGQPVLLAGAVLFFVSDLAVARERFLVSDPRNRWIGLPLYYAAQLLFAQGTP